jgi:hypothetical protein
MVFIFFIFYVMGNEYDVHINSHVNSHVNSHTLKLILKLYFNFYIGVGVYLMPILYF